MIASGKTKTKIFLPAKQKLDILEKLQSGASISDLACEFNVSKVTVRRIGKEGPSLKNLMSEEAQLLQRKILRKPIYEDLDCLLYQWYLDRRMMGVTLTDRLLKEKALDICSRLGSSSTFSASRGWLRKFKQRHDIHVLCKHRKRRSTGEEGHDKFTTVNVSCEDEQEIQEELQDKLQEEPPEEAQEEPPEEAQEEIKEKSQKEIRKKVREEPPENPESILSSEERKKKDLDTLVEITEQYANNDRIILRLGMFLRELLEDKQIPE